MIPVSPDAERLLRFTIDTLAQDRPDYRPYLVAHFEEWSTERGEFSDYMRRLNAGEKQEELEAAYGTIRPDYSTLNFGIGGYPSGKTHPERQVEFLGAMVEFSPTCRRLLKGRRLELDRATMKILAIPQPDAEFVRQAFNQCRIQD